MLQLKIISPERIVFTGEVTQVVVPGTLGEFEILDNHAPIISSLEKGKVDMCRFMATRSLSKSWEVLSRFRRMRSACVSSYNCLLKT